MTTHAPIRPPWRFRLLALLGFFGAAPLIWFLPVRRRAPFLAQQTGQALVLGLVLAGILLINVVLFLAVSYLLVFDRGFYEGWPVERVVLDIEGTMQLLWGIAWLIGVAKALAGSTSGIPYLTRLRDSPTAVRCGLIACVAMIAFLGVVALLVGRAADAADNELHPAMAYMLYDDLDWVPPWVFELGFYPIARAVEAKWGPGNAVVVPFTKEALDMALAHGAFVFLSSHGTEDGLYTRDRWFKPEDIARIEKGPDLRYVYITGCDSGNHAKAWEDAMAPAKVITFNRLSAVVEHIFWLWFRGPGAVRELASFEAGHAQ